MKQTKKKESAAHKKLAAELIALIPELDEEGLSFLIEQSRVHLYNMEIEREEAEAAAESAEVGGGGKKKSAGKGGSAQPAAPDQGPANFRIERSSSGSSYHLISGGKWKMFNEEEMMAIVKIANAAEPVNEVAWRLHEWFTEERPDTFADLEIGDKHDPKMRELVTFLRGKFAIRKR
jgi:hypothetical protein